MSKKPLKLLILAGEASGDEHAAIILKDLKVNFENLETRALGSSKLKNAGAKIVVDNKKYASLNGFNLPIILYKSSIAFSRLLYELLFFKPDCVLLVDYPDFNLRFSLFPKLLRIPVVYLIPPTVWAWREGRAKTIKNRISHTLSIFPFEKEYYRKLGVENITYIGNPTFQEMKNYVPKISKKEFCKLSNIDPKNKIFLFLPGSRKSEVKRHMPILTQSIKKLSNEISNVTFIISKAPGIDENLIPNSQNYITSETDARDLMTFADCALIKSGTSNLEAAILNLPFSMFYTLNSSTFKILDRILKTKVYSLVNILRPNTTKELIQNNFTAEKASKEILELLSNQEKRTKMKEGFSEIRQSLTTSKEPQLIANKIIAEHLINGSRQTRTVSRVLQYLKPYKKSFLVALICMILFAATDGAIPFLLKMLIENVFVSKNSVALSSIPFILIAFALVRGSLDFSQSFISSKIGHNIVKDVRNHTHSHLLKLSPSFFVNNSVGNILARFTSDVILVRDFLTSALATLIRDTVKILVLMASAFFLDPFLALIAFIGFPLGIYPIYRFGKRMRKLGARGQEEIGEVSSLVQESVLGNKVIQSFRKEDFEKEKFQEKNQKLTKTFIKSELVKAVTGPVNELVAIVAISLTILYGGSTVIGGSRGLGNFIAFLTAVYLLYDPFKKLSKLNNNVQQSLSGAERIFTILDSEPSIAESKEPLSLNSKNSIIFDNVSFTYDNNSAEALSDISFEIEEGKKAAVVGFSGAGKSTLVDLLPRFIDPTQGKILIGNVDIKEASLSELRSKIAVVSQHTFLFNTSIYDNIAYGKSNPTRDEVIQASKAAYAHDFVSNLPNGYDTIVGEAGMTLSGGERQRIAIARAILKDSPILILDEATASLDNKAEREVQLALEELSNNKTSIVIAHRLSTVKDADMIIVLENGKIAEIGSHGKLIGNDGAFAKLHQLQFAS